MDFEDLDAVLGQVDVCFVVDTTSSMGPFIDAAKEKALAQAKEIAERGDLDLRYAIVQYRDHPPQDNSFVEQHYGFFEEYEFQATLARLFPSGGGDRPEAAYDGLIAAGMLEWRDNAEKLCFLIGDSPPHNPCLCHATPGGVVEILGSKQIKLNAVSIAGANDTTEAFKELTDALSGETVEVLDAGRAFAHTGHAMSMSSDLIGHARAYTTHVSTMRASGARGMTVNSVAADLGWTPEMVTGTSAYLSSRGIEDPLTAADPPEKPVRKPRKKKE